MTTSFAVIIFALLLVLIEKPHLFKKPINIGKVTLLVLILGAAVANAVKEWKNNEQQDHANKVIDSLSGASKTLEKQLSALRDENTTAHEKHADSLSSYHYRTIEILAKYGYKVDSLNDVLTKLSDKVIKEIPPTLAILNTPKIEFLYDKKERVFSYTITSLNSDVHLLDYYYVFFKY